MKTSERIFPHSTMESHTVKMIEFGLLNPEEIVFIINYLKLAENVSL
jgi:hypothetical protein